MNEMERVIFQISKKYCFIRVIRFHMCTNTDVYQHIVDATEITRF